MRDKVHNVFDSLEDSDLKLISDLNLSEDKLNYVFDLLELIDAEDKKYALTIINNILSDETKLEEKLSKSEKYTRKLLGNNN